MKTLLVALFAFLNLVGCTDTISTDQARRIAASRLSQLVEPPQSAAQIEAALSVTKQGSKQFVEFREDSKNLMWAVIVKPDGNSEVSRTKIHEQPATKPGDQPRPLRPLG